MDNRIPPPLVATLFGLLMWFAAQRLPGADYRVAHQPGVGGVVSGRSYLSSRCAVLPPRPHHSQPAQAGNGFGSGQFGRLQIHTQPHVLGLRHSPDSLVNLPRLAAGTSRRAGLRAVHEPVPDRTGGAGSRQPFRERVHALLRPS